MQPQARWETGIEHEIAFWRGYLQSGGGAWPEDFVRRLDPEAPMAADLGDLIAEAPGEPVRILDVGAGPLSVVGRRGSSKAFVLTAVDPLAAHYDRLLEEAGLTPPVRTETGYVERLGDQFGEGAFDIVHMQNALDHSADPLAGLHEMLHVVKVGGSVLLKHHLNEAEREHYEGFHQWNLCVEGDDFVIWNKGARHNVTARLGADVAVRNTLLRDGTYVITTLKKLRPLAPAKKPWWRLW